MRPLRCFIPIAFFALAHLHAQIPYEAVVLADQPAAYWRMGEPPGSPYATDVSGHAKSAVVQGGPVFFGQPGALHGDSNTSVDLGGAGYFLTPLLQTSVSQYALEAWIKTNEVIAPILQDRGYNDFDNGGALSITLSVSQPEQIDGAVHCSVDGDNIDIGGITQNRVNDGKWHHVVCVFSGQAGQAILPSQISIYVDGVLQPLVYSHDGNATAPVTGSGGTTIGVHPIWQQQFGMPRYIGLLDEVAVYSHALSAARVRAHYLAGVRR